jgi:hypothetical protein
VFGLVVVVVADARSAGASSRTVGTLGIAAGATIVAIASGVGAGYDIVPLFSVGLAAGVSVMVLGFPPGREAVSPSVRAAA